MLLPTDFEPDELKESSSAAEESLIAFCKDQLAGFRRPKKIANETS
jgi:hypothetical protein